MKFLELLNGKKTYGLVAIGLIYLVGDSAGAWQIDESVLGALGLAIAAALRSGVKKVEPAAEGEKESHAETQRRGENSKAGMLPLLLVAAMVVCAGCSTLWKSTVTIEGTVHAGMQVWAELSKGGFTSEKLDEGVRKAHAKYFHYSKTALNVLIAYRDGRATKEDYERAFLNTQETALAVVDALYFVLEPQEQAKARSAIRGAKEL
jgi:uncharacterized protein YsxB (DUF464 family)